MELAKLNYAVDVGMLASLIMVAATGIIKMPGIASALGFGRGSGSLGIITPLHDISGILLIVFAIMHLALHWGWLAGMTGRLLSRK